MNQKKGKKILTVAASVVLAASVFPQGGKVLGDTENALSIYNKEDTTPPEIQLMEGTGEYFGKMVGRVNDESAVKLYLYEGNSAVGVPKELTVTWFGFFTINKEAESKTYTLVAIDAAGNKTERQFTVGAYNQSDKKDGTASIEVDGLYYGETPVVYPKSETNGTDHVVIYWKQSSEEDSAYTTLAPKETGVYTVKAVFAATEQYKEVTVYKTVSITYMELTDDMYVISGQEGENGWYTSDVEIIPKSGFLISENYEDESFKGSLIFKETQKNLSISLKNPDSGAITEIKELPVIQIDKMAPVLSGIIDGQAYEQNEELSVTVHDENLDKVLLNGQEIDLMDEQTAIVKIAPENEKASYMLEARDKAGNIASITFTLVNSNDEKPIETNKPIQTDAPKETKKPTATETAKPVDNPKQTDVPKETKKPTVAETAKPTEMPKQTDVPKETKKPNPADISKPTQQPGSVRQPSNDEWIAPHTVGQNANNAQPWQLEDTLIKESGLKYVRAGMLYRLGEGTWRVKGDPTVYVGGGYFYIEQSGNYEFILE